MTTMTMNLTAYILIALVLFLFSAIKILREYERGVIFLLGKFYKVKGPGVIIVIPGLQKMVKVSLRTVVMDVPPQDIITKDNVTVKVNAVVYFRVLDPRKAIIEVEDSSTPLRKSARPHCAVYWVKASSTICWPIARTSTSTCRK